MSFGKYAFGTLVLGIAGIAAAGGCLVTEAANTDCVANTTRVCTACENSDPNEKRPFKGRQLCGDDGKYGACEECAPYDPGSEGEIVTNPTPPAQSPAGIDPACNGKLAVVAGRDAADEQSVTGVVFNEQKFILYPRSGFPMRGPAAVAFNAGGILVAYRSRNDQLVAGTFRDGMWSTPDAVPGVLTDRAPALVNWGSKVKAFFHGTDGRYHAANLEAGRWSAGIEALGSTTRPAPSDGTAPAAGMVGAPGIANSMMIVLYTDHDGALYRQQWTDKWQPYGVKVASAKPGRPTLFSMASGAYDFISAYVGTDGVIHTSVRSGTDKNYVWSEDITVPGSSRPLADGSDAITGTALPGGRAMIVFRDYARKGRFSLFDPVKKAWSEPAELIAGANPILASTPQVTEDRCGAEAVLAYAITGKSVGVLRYDDGKWQGPFVIPDLANMTYATAIASP